MGTVTFRFVEPDSWVGRLICWRLKEPWSHVSILFHDCAYSAQVPLVVKLSLDHRSVAMPPRVGKDVIMLVSDADELKMRQWCESQLGKTYDFASILGWALGWSWLQSRKNTYCFEFVRECLGHMGWLRRTNRLIKGNRLIEDIGLLMARHVNTQGDVKVTLTVDQP
jgi:hypothetical protein